MNAVRPWLLPTKIILTFIRSIQSSDHPPPSQYPWLPQMLCSLKVLSRTLSTTRNTKPTTSSSVPLLRTLGLSSRYMAVRYAGDHHLFNAVVTHPCHIVPPRSRHGSRLHAPHFGPISPRPTLPTRPLLRSDRKWSFQPLQEQTERVLHRRSLRERTPQHPQTF